MFLNVINYTYSQIWNNLNSNEFVNTLLYRWDKAE